MSGSWRTPPEIVRRNGIILAVSIAAAFVGLRLHLAIDPNADFNVGQYNIHHLFTGLLLITAGGIPLALFRGTTRRMDISLIVFGVGLAMALDEWVYLIATDGSNASYLLPVSFWGAVVVIGLALAYAFALVTARSRSAAGGARPRSADGP